MSYILDALKKSEEKRGVLPRSAAQPATSHERELGQRRIGLLVVLVIGALMVGWWVAQWQGSDMHESKQVQKYPAFSAAMMVPEQLGGEASVDEDGVALNQSRDSGQEELMNPMLASDVEIPVIHIEQEPPVFTAVTPTSSLTEISEEQPALASSQATQQSMSAIKIEGHIYDENPDARMVIINGKVRKEKQTISAGLLLQEITPDGVILNYQGRSVPIGVFDQ